MKTQSPAVAKPCVLVVDDRPESLVAFQAALSMPDFGVMTASSGRAALRAMLENDFAALVLDVQLPDLNGFEIARLVRQREATRELPILFITGVMHEPGHILQGYESGAVDYLVKPVDHRILRSKVRIFVELHESRQKLMRHIRLLDECESRDLERQLAKLEARDLRRYKSLADAIPHLVWRTDVSGEVEYVNQMWCQYSGIAADASLKSGWRPAIHPEDLRMLEASWAFARRRGLLGFDLECRVLRGKDAVWRWHLVTGVAERNDCGSVVGWLVTYTDVHERRERSHRKLSA